MVSIRLRRAPTLALLVLSTLLAPCQATAQSPAPPGIPDAMEQWETSFLKFRGTWTSAGNGMWDGQWNNGAVATLTMERFDANAVIVTRRDTRGLTPGISARYTGRITSPGVIEGTVTWHWPGMFGYPRSGTWGATFDPPGTPSSSTGCGESSLLPPLQTAASVCSDPNLPFRYNTQSKAHHIYRDFTSVCSLNQSNRCTVENVFAIMSRTPGSIAPVTRSVTAADIVSCSVLELRSCPTSKNEIRIVIDEAAHSITNYTLPTHMFYPGHVTRQIVGNGDIVGVETVGAGVGCQKMLNEAGARCKIWPDADHALKAAVWDELRLGQPPPLAGDICSDALGFVMWLCDKF